MKLFIIAFLFVFTASANASDLSGGLIVGSHNGVVLKWDLPKNRAIDAGLTHAIDSMYGLSIFGDYLFENVKSFDKFNMYAGGGVRLLQIRSGSDENKTRIGFRAPVGLVYATSSTSEFYGELAPALYIMNVTGLALDGGIGFRIKF
ncbi:MAG: hypothetical protein ABL930_05805 [Pseudobdellovibrio sp.]